MGLKSYDVNGLPPIHPIAVPGEIELLDKEPVLEELPPPLPDPEEPGKPGQAVIKIAINIKICCCNSINFHIITSNIY
jgi:hypothetical protein